MKQQEVFKKIGGIIREINEQYEYLAGNEGAFNELELELLVANAHFLADHIEILKKISTAMPQQQLPPVTPELITAEKAPHFEPPQPPTAQPEPEPEPTPEPVIEKAPEPAPEQEQPEGEPRYFEPVMETEEEEEKPVAETKEKEQPSAPVVEFEIGSKSPAPETVDETPEPEAKPEPVESIRHELTLEDIGGDWDEDEDTEEKDIKPEPAEIAAVQAELVSPKPASQPVPPHPKQSDEEEVMTLNQRISQQMSGAASRAPDHLNMQPVADLKAAITLNDKMLYVRDLFNGYSLAYSEVLDILNRMKNFEEAENFLKNSYALKNNWADKQATADKFYALVSRRYL